MNDTYSSGGAGVMSLHLPYSHSNSINFKVSRLPPVFVGQVLPFSKSFNLSDLLA